MLNPSDQLSQWTGGNLRETGVIFYQGKDSSQLQACKYLGNLPMLATTGEMVTFRNPGILTIPRESLWTYPEIAEIERTDHYAWLSVLKHMFRNIRVLGAGEPNDYKPLYSAKEAGSVYRYSVSNTSKSLGQDTDIESHKAKYNALTSTDGLNIQNIILYAVSRGGATTFAALAKNDYKNVKLCILEGPPASVRGIVKDRAGSLGEVLYDKNRWLVSLLFGKRHEPIKEKQAIAHAKKFPKDVPLMIVSSQKDNEVPHKNSIKLALSVAADRIRNKTAGQDLVPVYFLQLDHSGHNGYALKGTSSDPDRYQNAVHAAYKKFKLPYIEQFAEAGKDDLEIANLTEGALAEQVLLQAEFKEAKDNPTRRSEIRKSAFNKLCEALKDCDEKKKKRIITICLAMPLYYKHIKTSRKFGKNDAEHALQDLLKPSKLPQESKNIISKGIDYCNHDLFEGLFDFFLHPVQTEWAYRDWSKKLLQRINATFLEVPMAIVAASLGIVLRLVLLPLTSFVYALSRLSLVVLNPNASDHNEAKALLMRTVAAVATVIISLVGYFFINQHSLENFSQLFGLSEGVGPVSSIMAGAVILGALATMGFSCLLHAAKKVAQWVNREKLQSLTETIYATAPKHCNLLYRDNVGDKNLIEYYRTKKPAIFGGTSKMSLTQFEMVTEQKYRGEQKKVTPT